MNPASLVLAAGASMSLLLGLHPFATYPLMLGLVARWRPRPWHPAALARRPSVAVCVCAYNEEAMIGDRIRNIIAARRTMPGLEILVYADGASDRTADILRGFGKAITAVISPVRLGKTQGMNTLVGLTRADIIVFSDANVMFAPDALPNLLEPFADPLVGCVCGHLRYAQAEGQTAATGSLYWRLEEHLKSLESATGSVMGADGSIFAIRRALHTPPPPHLIDDMYVSLQVLCRGTRVVRAPRAFAYEAAVSTSREEFQRKIRIACQAFNVHRALSSSLRHLSLLDQFKYVSHKLLRWLSIFFLSGAVLLFASALAAAHEWIALLAATLAGALCLIALATARHGPLARLREVAGALVATGFGVLRSLRGDRFQTWTPPASARAAPAQRAAA